MANPYVQIVGAVEDIDGRKLQVGTDYDTVTIAAFRLTSTQLEELRQLIVTARSQAAVNSERMREEAADG